MNCKKLIGYVWAAPLTVIGLLYILPMMIMGYYAWAGTFGDVLVWRITPSSVPAWLRRRWRGLAAVCLGNVAVVKYPPRDSIMGRACVARVQTHAREVMQLGILWVISYALGRLWHHRW